MTNKILLNDGWKFSKDQIEARENVVSCGSWVDVNLPHTWNGTDGQDGGNDYYRGLCLYAKTVSREELPKSDAVYIQFEGVNSSAELFVNGKSLACHEGGYSTWRVNITDAIADTNEIVVTVDNSKNDRVYPQNADFTFYGGIYRAVTLIGAPALRFDLDYFGGEGVMITPRICGKDAKVAVKTFVIGDISGAEIKAEIFDGERLVTIGAFSPEKGEGELVIENVHLWNGTKDPHLYTAKVSIVKGGESVDCRCIDFGCRSFEISADRGFILNGEEYPLRGVSRHQDRPKKGNALSREDHEEDIALITEMGANTIRLAHYQHDQYFYKLCDKAGIVVWAEIPYISSHMPNGRENTLSQMTELIVQNYNHPCIAVWGLSNEITMGGASNDDLLENHKELNDLCHSLDPTRPTTVAVVSMCKPEDPYVRIPDVRSFNHYFGWYGGDTSMNGPWFDNYHAQFPNEPVGLSEYGCEALNWHTSKPMQGDYTEEYQAYYHEELIKQIAPRKYLWATHVWNMFDFAADARSEGGEDGMNHKGLVTFDRKYKKDSYYAYKAWLNPEPMVHICGKRYVDRVEDVTKVTVYSNLPQLELYANGELVATQQKGEYPFFYFDVPNVGETVLTAKAGELSDESRINKVSQMNPAYVLPEVIGGEVLNWFDIEEPEGYFNINCTLGEIIANPQGNAFFNGFIGSLMSGGPGVLDIKPEDMAGIRQMMMGFTVKRILSMAGTLGAAPLTKAQIIGINKQLNMIKK